MTVAITAILFYLIQRAYGGAWGRMMRAIRDNYVAAESMGKNVKGRQVELFVLGAVLIGIAGALMTTYVQLYDPSSYQPINYTFIVWVMVIVGGAGNNLGAIFGGVLIIIAWNMSAPVSLLVFGWIDDGLHALRLPGIPDVDIARPADARVHPRAGDRAGAALRAEGADPGTHPPPRGLSSRRPAPVGMKRGPGLLPGLASFRQSAGRYFAGPSATHLPSLTVSSRM